MQARLTGRRPNSRVCLSWDHSLLVAARQGNRRVRSTTGLIFRCKHCAAVLSIALRLDLRTGRGSFHVGLISNNWPASRFVVPTGIDSRFVPKRDAFFQQRATEARRHRSKFGTYPRAHGTRTEESIMRRYLVCNRFWLWGTAVLAVSALIPRMATAQGDNCTAGQLTTTGSGTASSATTSSASSQLTSVIASLQQQLQSGTLTAAQQQRATRLLAALQRVQSLNGSVNAAQLRQVNSLVPTTAQTAQPNVAAIQAQRLGNFARASSQVASRAAGGGAQRQFQAGGRGR